MTDFILRQKSRSSIILVPQTKAAREHVGFLHTNEDGDIYFAASYTKKLRAGLTARGFTFTWETTDG